MDKPILISGIPRSGTTWVAEVLSYPENVKYIHEPDNERRAFLAHYFKQGLARFPYLRFHDNHNGYYKLFRGAFHDNYSSIYSFTNRFMRRLNAANIKVIEEDHRIYGKNKEGRLPSAYYYLYKLLPKDLKKPKEKDLRVVKSVHHILALPFLIKNFNLHHLVVIRNPLNVFSSYKLLNNKDAVRNIHSNQRLIKDFNLTVPEFNDRYERAGLQISMFYYMIERYVKEYDMCLVRYESILDNPVQYFQRIYNQFGLAWNDGVREFIESKNKKGSGYTTNRIFSEQKEVWKNRLKSDEIERFLKGYNTLKNDLYPQPLHSNN